MSVVSDSSSDNMTSVFLLLYWPDSRALYLPGAPCVGPSEVLLTCGAHTDHTEALCAAVSMPAVCRPDNIICGPVPVGFTAASVQLWEFNQGHSTSSVQHRTADLPRLMVEAGYRRNREGNRFHLFFNDS